MFVGKTFGLITTACAVSLLAMTASAQTAGMFMTNPAFADPPPKDCTNTVDMQHCAAHDLRRADAQMSKLYKAKRAGLDQAGKTQLLQEQRKWLKDRDSNCMAHADQYGGGTMASIAVAQCWVEVTTQRADALEK